MASLTRKLKDILIDVYYYFFLRGWGGGEGRLLYTNSTWDSIYLQFGSSYPLLSRHNPLDCRLRDSQLNPISSEPPTL